jgi:hypothetical protein
LGLAHYNPPRHMGLLLLFISLLLMLAVCRAWARRAGRTAGEQFWVGVVAAGLQLGTIAVALSALQLVTPIAWLAAQAVTLAATLLVTRRGQSPAAPGGGLLGETFATTATKLAALAVLAIVLLAMAEQFALPVREFDDRMYHGSRAAYWLQHRSVFGYTTHNERQVAFPFGGELWFLWPLLFTRSEAAAQLGFGVALPLCAIGIYWTLREAGASRSAAALGTVAFCFAPMVLYHTRGIRTELWAALYASGCAFWALRAARDDGRAIDFLLAGACFGLAVNVKATMLPMMLGLAVLPWLARRDKGYAAAAVVAGAVAGLVFSGFVATAAYNWREHGHPLGSRTFQEVHRADVSRTQVRTHAARFLLALLDPPAAPTPAVRDALERTGARLARALRADAPLPHEEKPWPGTYAYRVPAFGGNYSLAGFVWAPLLVVALVLAAWDVARTWPAVRLSPPALAALFAAPALLGAVVMIRWTAGVPRFWVPAYALGVLVFVPMLDRFATGRRWVGAACAVALLLMAAPAAWFHAQWSHANLTTELSPVGLDEPFFEPLAHIEDGSTILLFAAADARDYPLFAPRRGFANRVIPWGPASLDVARTRRLLQDGGVTHVLVQTDPQPDWSGNATRDVDPIVDWLTRQPDLAEIPLPYTPRVRLFAVRWRRNGPPATGPIR